MPIPRTPSPEQLRILRARAEREGLHASIIERLNVILHFAEHPFSISETCRQFGISRSTFHRWIDRFDPTNLSSLADKSREPQTLRQSSIDPETLELIRRYRMRYPQMGKERIAELLMQDHGVDISPSSVGRVIERECLYFADTPFHWKKRLSKRGTGPCGTSVITEHEPTFVPVAPEPEDILAQGFAIEPETHETLSSRNRHVVLIRPFDWKSVRRLIILSSVVTNIAFVLLLLGSALLERSSMPVPSAVQPPALHATPAAHYIP